MKRRDLLKGIAALAALGPTVAKAASHPDVEKPRYEVITLESRFGPSPYSPEREILRERIRNLPEVRDLIERRVLEKIGATEYDFRPLPMPQWTPAAFSTDDRGRLVAELRRDFSDTDRRLTQHWVRLDDGTWELVDHA